MMRISEATVAPVPGSNLLQVELSTDERLTGRALCCGPGGDDILALARGILIGRDPRSVAGLWDALGEATADGAFPAAGQARAALDIACWDLKAKTNGEPLWKTLGGGRPRAVAYGSWRGAYGDGDEPLDDFRTFASGGGFHRGLLRLGSDASQDGRLLALLRDTLVEQAQPVELMLDFGGAWPGDAVRRIAALEAEFDITWVKGIARPGDYRGCGHVADRVRAAVCAGGELASERDFLPLLHPQSVNVIEIDVQRLGVTGALRVAEAAFGYELPVTLSAAPGNLPVHLSSVMPNFMGMEVIDVDGGVGAPRFEAGRATAPDGPGTGIGTGGGATR